MLSSRFVHKTPTHENKTCLWWLNLTEVILPQFTACVGEKDWIKNLFEGMREFVPDVIPWATVGEVKEEFEFNNSKILKVKPINLDGTIFVKKSDVRHNPKWMKEIKKRY